MVMQITGRRIPWSAYSDIMDKMKYLTEGNRLSEVFQSQDYSLLCIANQIWDSADGTPLKIWHIHAYFSCLQWNLSCLLLLFLPSFFPAVYFQSDFDFAVKPSCFHSGIRLHQLEHCFFSNFLSTIVIQTLLIKTWRPWGLTAFSTQSSGLDEERWKQFPQSIGNVSFCSDITISHRLTLWKMQGELYRPHASFYSNFQLNLIWPPWQL